MLIQEKSDEFLINRLFDAWDEFRFALSSLNTLDDQHQLLSFLYGLRSDSQKSSARVQSLELQVVVRSTELAFAGGTMIRLEQSFTVAHRQLAGVQLALRMFEGSAINMANVLVLRSSGVAVWRRCLAFFVVDWSIIRLYSTPFGASSVQIWTTILTFICRLLLPQCAIVQPAFALRLPT